VGQSTKWTTTDPHKGGRYLWWAQPGGRRSLLLQSCRMKEERSFHRNDSPHPWLVLSATSLGAVLTAINGSILTAALPVVVRHFGAGPIASNWILLSYMFPVTILIVSFGRLADILGRARLYIAGLALLTVSGFLLGFAPSLGTLLALRVLQAIGAGLVLANAVTLVTDAFSSERLGEALGINTMVVSAGQLLGPVLGGLVAATLGWRWLFWLNVPLGILAIAWAGFALRGLRSPTRREPLDLPGNLLYGMAFGGLLLSLSLGGAVGWTHPLTLAGIALFGLLLPGFVVVEIRSRFPMVDPTLFRNRRYALANAAAFLNSLTRFAVPLLLALYFQAAEGADPLRAGMMVVPVPVSMMIASLLAARLSRRVAAETLATYGLALSALGLVAILAALRPDMVYAWMVPGLVVTGAGFGLFVAPNTSVIMLSIPPQRRGVANGIRWTLQNTATMVSTALSLAVVTSPLPARVRDAFYAGAVTELGEEGTRHLIAGYRVAFLFMGVVTLVAVGASRSRTTGLR